MAHWDSHLKASKPPDTLEMHRVFANEQPVPGLVCTSEWELKQWSLISVVYVGQCQPQILVTLGMFVYRLLRCVFEHLCQSHCPDYSGINSRSLHNTSSVNSHSRWDMHYLLVFINCRDGLVAHGFSELLSFLHGSKYTVMKCTQWPHCPY